MVPVASVGYASSRVRGDRNVVPGPAHRPGPPVALLPLGSFSSASLPRGRDVWGNGTVGFLRPRLSFDSPGSRVVMDGNGGPGTPRRGPLHTGSRVPVDATSGGLVLPEDGGPGRGPSNREGPVGPETPRTGPDTPTPDPIRPPPTLIPSS